MTSTSTALVVYTSSMRIVSIAVPVRVLLEGRGQRTEDRGHNLANIDSYRYRYKSAITVRVMEHHPYKRATATLYCIRPYTAMSTNDTYIRTLRLYETSNSIVSICADINLHCMHEWRHCYELMIESVWCMILNE